ncbi:putative phospholipid-transporting ATPase IH [Orchesella cincta]|uniref:Putative phospholipid-transporting ATPase IH n=1 Tax=Orchesella cincta TaxID=48709 RepID=A0A1D2NE54_ORCCI|nr:putative phospholipid-transporting ATPase IH [Orchesella cincta]
MESILGKEGRQAARSADFAISKFGYLRRAILVHGHWYYVRLANLANYFFYKNVVFIMPQFFFSFNSNFSTQPIFNGLFLMNFNIFFSSVPIFVFGLTEQPYSAETLLSQPHLYKRNRKNSLMTVKKFLPWFLSSLWHSVVVYYLPYLSWNNFDNMNDISTFGTIVFTGVVVVANCKMAVETRYMSWWFLASQLFSYASYLFFAGMFSEVDLRPGLQAGEFHHVFFSMLSSVCFWLLMLLVGVTATIPDIIFAVVRHSWKNLVRHFKGLGKGSKWLKTHQTSIPLTNSTLLFSKRSGTLTISNSTLTSYLPNA